MVVPLKAVNTLAVWQLSHGVAALGMCGGAKPEAALGVKLLAYTGFAAFGAPWQVMQLLAIPVCRTAFDAKVV
jgi:hypothetical protein